MHTVSTTGGFAIDDGHHHHHANQAGEAAPAPAKPHHADMAVPLGPTAVPTFDAVFVTEYPKMVALAAAVSGRRDSAEDLAQEAMTRLHRNWSRIQGFQSPGAWVRRVTINLALSQRRRLANEAKARLRLRSTPPRRLAPTAAEHEPVWQAVARLPGKQRAVVALRYLEDRSIDDIADVLQIAPSTVRVHLHRAGESLRQQLGDFDPRPLGAVDQPGTPTTRRPGSEHR